MNGQLQLSFAPPRPRAVRGQVYFDTTRLPLAQLTEAITSAARQDEQVLAVFRAHQQLTPSRCLRHLEAARVRMLLTSVRRSISTLTKAGALVRTAERLPGPWGVDEYVWALNSGPTQVLA